MKELTQQSIGKVLGPEHSRDAIHIAVAPLVASEVMRAGQHVALLGTETAGLTGHAIGIVDPFLSKPVQPGQRFYVFLYPNTITSLRHEWTHPSFSGEAEESRRWLTRFAENNETTYEGLIEMLRAGRVLFGSTNWQDTLFNQGSKDEFWGHVEAVMGRDISEKEREGIRFSCAC